MADFDDVLDGEPELARDQAVLTVSDVRRAMQVAAATGVRAHALMAWMYEYGARAAEPGLQLMRDTDVRNWRARPTHLKNGRAKSWHAMMRDCRAALPPWLAERPAAVLAPEQAGYLFPSGSPGKCYACHGTGKRPISKRKGKKDADGRYSDSTHPCHHCGETGKRWGISRIEVYDVVHDVLTRSGAPFQHPHVLRHSIITHLLNGKVEPARVRDRVGHRQLSTTLDYVRMTNESIEQMEAALGYEEDEK